MNQRFLRIASRIAGRLDVLRQVDSAFESVGVYPPSMNQSGPGVYKGNIDTGWDLEVQEMPNGDLITKLNGKKFPSPVDAAKEYKANKNKPVPAVAVQAVKIAPATGTTATGLKYDLQNYNFDGSSHERIHAKWTSAAGNMEADIESTVGQPVPQIHVLTQNGTTIPLDGGIAISMSEIFENAMFKKMSEIDAAASAAGVPEWPGPEGSGFLWLQEYAHEVVDGELELNLDADAGLDGDIDEEQLQEEQP